MSGHLTPQQAAKKAKVGRTTIMRALESQELKAIRNNSGRWQITHEALEDWLSMRTVQPTVRTPAQNRPQTDGNEQALVEARIEVAKLTTEVKGLEARLSDTQAERDRLADALKSALERRPGILTRIFGR